MKWIIEAEGREWEFDDDHLTIPEAQTQKRLTKGMTPLQCDQARMGGDPDAILAALVIARRRSGVPYATAEKVDKNTVDVVDVLHRTFKRATEAAEALQAEPEPAAEPAPKRRRAPRKAAPAEEPAPAA